MHYYSYFDININKNLSKRGILPVWQPIDMLCFSCTILNYFSHRIWIWYPFLGKINSKKLLAFKFYLSLFNTEETETWIIAMHYMEKG